MGLNDGTGQELQNGDTVRTMSDLPDRGLDGSEIIGEKFFKNKILEILNFNTGNNDELIDILDILNFNIGNNNELIDRIDDSQKEEELYSRYIDLGDYQEALQVCISMIQRELEREISERVQGGYILKPGTDEVNFDTVSTPTALKWKQRIEEIEDIAYSKLKESGKTKEALELCNLMIREEVKKQFLRGSQRGFNFRNLAYEVNFDAVSTPTALKWKQRIEEIEDIVYSKLKESGKTKEALELCNLMIQGEVEREVSERVQGGYILKPGTDDVNFDTVSTSTALKWKQRITELTK